MRTKILTLLSIFTLLAFVSTYGQTIDSVRAKIPFEFNAAGKVFPAGDYNFVYNAAGRAVKIDRWL